MPEQDRPRPELEQLIGGTTELFQASPLQPDGTANLLIDSAYSAVRRFPKSPIDLLSAIITQTTVKPEQVAEQNGQDNLVWGETWNEALQNLCSYIVETQITSSNPTLAQESRRRLMNERPNGQ